MIVADYVANFLVTKGVRNVFGYQGSAVLKLIDAIVSTGKIRYVQGYHEQASAFSADAYARTTRSPGVALATSGPGAANLISGIANAYFDSVPVLFITGQDRLSHIENPGRARQNGFQDMDVVSMVRPITKYAVQLHSPEEIVEILPQAWDIMQADRKGSVLIDIPFDLFYEDVDIFERPLSNRYSGCSPKSFKEVLKLLGASTRPLLLVGGGVANAGFMGNVELLSKRCRLPYVTTLQGMCGEAGGLGMAGLFGTTRANKALRRCDLLVVLGARMAFHHVGKSKSGYAPRAKIVQIDIDKAELERLHDWKYLCIEADACEFIKQAIEDASIPAWEDWYNMCRSVAESDKAQPIQDLAKILGLLPTNAIICADVGANEMWTAKALGSRGDLRLLASGGHGAMGYALPAAIGASFGDSQVVTAVTGDGGLQMNLQELNYLKNDPRAVKIIVLNNGSLGLMRMAQKRYFDSRFIGNYGSEFSCPDLRRLAQVYDIPFISVDVMRNISEVRDILASQGPAILEVHVDENEVVLSSAEDGELNHG